MSTDPLKPLRDEAFRKLGRNLTLFQQLEQALKRLIAQCELEGSTPEELREFAQSRREGVARKTFGTLVGRYVDEVLSSETEDDFHPTADDARFRIRAGFRFSGDEERVSRLSALVDERNHLVHHLLEHYDLRSEEGVRKLDEYLEPQANRIREEIAVLASIIEAVNLGRSQMAEFFASEQGQAHFELMWLRASRIVVMMAQIAFEIAREDGWSVLPLAAWRLHERAPEELQNMDARYGHKNLVELLRASGLFDLRDEPTAKGGTRQLYRCMTPAG